MRPGHQKRMRGRHRKGPNPLSRTYESNGPDVKIRGTAQHIMEKYVQLARDAQASGDPVTAESYFQHAEHYYRLIAAAQQQFQPQQGNFYRPGDQDLDEGEDDDEEGQPFLQGAPQPYPEFRGQNGYGAHQGQERHDRQGQGHGQERAQPPVNGDNGQHYQPQNGEGRNDRREARGDFSRGDRFEPRGDYQRPDRGEGRGDYQRPDRGEPRQDYQRDEQRADYGRPERPDARQDQTRGEPREPREARQDQPRGEPREPREARQDQPRGERRFPPRGPRPSTPPRGEEGSESETALPSFITAPMRPAPVAVASEIVEAAAAPEPVESAAPRTEEGDAEGGRFPFRSRRRRRHRGGFEREGAEGEASGTPAAQDAPTGE